MDMASRLIEELILTAFSKVDRLEQTAPRRTIDPRLQKKVGLRVSEIIHMMKDEKWAEIRQQFTPVLRILLTESELKNGGDMMALIAGRLERVGHPVVSKGWITTTAKVPVNFQRINLAMVLQMTSSGNPIGLCFMPMSFAGLAASWKPPDYAPKGSYREENLQLGLN